MISNSSIELPKELLDHYTDLYQELGIGGFAKVILARHNYTGLKVAIKIIIKELVKNELFRVHEEIMVMKKLSHQNICKLYQVYETDEHVFMVLEYISGGELYDQIVLSKEMSEKEARRIFRQVLSAVGYIHSCGIAHRDLKPENILIDEFKNIRIIDFGLSANPTGGLINPLDTLCGSIAYAAPELLSGQPYMGNEVDVWSMGVLLFTLLCGYLPFENDSNIQNALNNIKNAIYQFPQGISKEAKSLISGMLEPDPKKRQTVWNLAHHDWVTRGYGSPVSWGVFSENVLNEITAHYAFLKQQRTYKGLSYTYTLYNKSSKNTNIETQPNILKDIEQNDILNEEKELLPKPLLNKSTQLKENDEKSNPKYLYQDISKSLHHVKKRKINCSADITPKRSTSSDLNNPKSPPSKLNDSSFKIKKKVLIGRIAELFTPKKYQTPSNIPRSFKPAGNIRKVEKCDYAKLQSIFDVTLLELKNNGTLFSIKFENFIYKCEKLCAKKNRLVFTIEICQVSVFDACETGIVSQRNVFLGILTKRIKGDSWEYKKAIEEIMKYVIDTH
ncbi:hypothetical protein HZS_7851, partial [Henneguya salminicola]